MINTQTFKNTWGAIGLSLVIGFASMSHVHAQAATPGTAKNNPHTNYEHCLVMVNQPAPTYGNKYPKGFKYLSNVCNHDIYIAWCYYDEGTRHIPQKRWDCGMEGLHFQKSRTLKPLSESEYSRMDKYQKFDVVVCKGKSKASVVFKGPFNSTNKYSCKDLSQARG